MEATLKVASFFMHNSLHWKGSGMQNQELFDLLIAEANHPFSGWNFSYISSTDRVVEEPLSWSYASKLLPLLRSSQSLLDMGTGGGEFLFRLQPLPPNTFATEGYTPNIPIARRRLEPLGVQVFEVSKNGQLPFLPWQIPYFT